MSAPLSPDTAKTSQASIAARAQALLSRLSQPSAASSEPVDAPTATTEPTHPLAPPAPPERIEERVAAEPEPSAPLTTFPAGFATGRVRLSNAFVRSPDYLSTVLALGGHECELYAIANTTDATIAHTTVTTEGYEFEHFDGRVSRIAHGFIADSLPPDPPANATALVPFWCSTCAYANECEACAARNKVDQRVVVRLYCNCGQHAPVSEHDADCDVHPSRFSSDTPVPLPRYLDVERHEKVGEEPYQFRLPDGSFEERKKNLWKKCVDRVRVEERPIYAAMDKARAEKAAREKAETKAAEDAARAKVEREKPANRPQLSLVPQASAAPARPTSAASTASASAPPGTDEAPPAEVIVLDTETTGIQRDARIVELAAVRVRLNDWTVTGEFVRLVNPGIPIPAIVSGIHGIYDRDVINAPSAPEVLAEFLAFALTSPCPWIAHNAGFDGARIAFELSRASASGHDLAWPRQQLWCTLKMARALWPKGSGLLEMPDHKLGTLVQRLRIQARPTHRALADVYSTIGVLREGMKMKPGVGLTKLCGDGVWL